MINRIRSSNGGSRVLHVREQLGEKAIVVSLLILYRRLLDILAGPLRLICSRCRLGRGSRLVPGSRRERDAALVYDKPAIQAELQYGNGHVAPWNLLKCQTDKVQVTPTVHHANERDDLSLEFFHAHSAYNLKHR